jgi:hypothetical protein
VIGDSAGQDVTYEYDIFLSYKRHSESRQWLVEHFQPLLESHVELEPDRKVTVFRAVVAVVLAVVLAVPACSSSPAAVADAASACGPDTVFTPVTITGTSSQGSLDIFHYATAGHVDGFCPDEYLISITPRPASFPCYGDPVFVLTISPPYGVGGPHAATASINDGHISSAKNVTFEPTQLDSPTAPLPRITGRFVSNDPPWSFDITLDLVSRYSSTCL